ncbi:MAG: YggT family protein [Proteobacteria bacterium]|nr:YggT family protein [Pseudomonadota bacterium]
MEYVINLASMVAISLKIYGWMHIGAFLLSWVNADPYNPIVSFINRLTIPLWDWVRTRVPPVISPLAPYLALMLVLFGEIAVPGLLRSLGATLLEQIGLTDGVANSFFYLLIGALSILNSIIWFIFLLAVIWFVLTLVNPPLNNPIVRTIMYLVDPLLTPLQKLLPRAKIDLSPIVLAGLSFFISRLILQVLVPLQAELII